MGRMTRPFIAVALAAVLSGADVALAQSFKFDDAFVEARRTLVRQIGQESHLVFIGTITALGSPPIAWSGRMRARQAVAYNVERVLKGFAPEPALTVYEPVVAKSRLAAATAEPGLAPALFKVGTRVIIFARKGVVPELFDGPDENVGVIASSTANDAAAEAALGLR